MARITMREIQEATAIEFEMSLDAMLDRTQAKAVLIARGTAMYLCRSISDFTESEVGRAFSKRDPTTVNNAVLRVLREMEASLEFAGRVQRLYGAIVSASEARDVALAPEPERAAVVWAEPPRLAPVLVPDRIRLVPPGSFPARGFSMLGGRTR